MSGARDSQVAELGDTVERDSQQEPAPGVAQMASGAESGSLSGAAAAAEPARDEWSGQLNLEAAALDEVQLKAIVEAVLYVTDEPLGAGQIAQALGCDPARVERVIQQLLEEYAKPEHGVFIREVAEGYAMATKPELHEHIRQFVKRMQPPLKLSRAALETLAVIAYKQPITAPEIMEIRGVQGLSVLKTLLERKLITTAGRKPVLGRPILYKTTKEFLKQFGLRSLADLPTLKEFEELARVAFGEEEMMGAAGEPKPETSQEPEVTEPAEELWETGDPPVEETEEAAPGRGNDG